MSTKRPAPVSRSIELIFFVSGLTGIVFQVIAFKVLGLVMGNSVHSVTAVVTSFMAGLAAGSYLAARLTPEQTPVRTYALLEAGIAGYILMFPALVDAAQPLLGQAYLTYGDHYQMLMLVRFAISGILLMIPTVLMGATLPVLTHALSSSASQTGSVAGRLYAINSLGAVFGAVLASFFILPNLGISTTLRILALTNLMIAWFALRSSGPALEPTTHSVAGKKRRGAKGFESVDRRVMALILGLSGFAAMGFEIAWTRALVLVVGTSTYAFSIILATFIGGISAGSAFATRYLVEEDEDLRPVIVWLLVGTATLGVLSLPLIGYLPLVQIDILLNFNANWWLLEVTQFLLVGVVTFLPAAFMGAGFPVALSLVTKGNQDTLGSASAVGTLYGSNTTGNILGSFATGALLIPMMGLQLTVLTISLIEGLAALVASAVLLPQGKRLVPSLAAIGIPLALYMILPSWNTRLLNSGPYVYAGIYSRDARLYKSDYFDAIQKNGEIIFHEEGVSATVAVIETPGGHRGLSINGKTDASSYQDMKTQRVVGHFPLLVHPDPKNALVIGLGSGVTLASVLKHRVQDVHLIEISPEVINSAAYFRQVNYGCLEDPRVRATVGDGRNHILHTQETYDVIVSEPTNPWIAGVGNLFSKEYFESCKKRLRPGGVMTAWVQIGRAHV